jgi:hypothetical protein
MTQLSTLNKYTWTIGTIIAAVAIAVVVTLITLPLLNAALVSLILIGVLVPSLLYVYHEKIAPSYATQPIGNARLPHEYESRLPMQQQTIMTNDGYTSKAWVVPVEQTEGYRFVLTADGYRVVDSTGQVVYTLR